MHLFENNICNKIIYLNKEIFKIKYFYFLKCLFIYLFIYLLYLFILFIYYLSTASHLFGSYGAVLESYHSQAGRQGPWASGYESLDTFIFVRSFFNCYI